MNDVSGKLKELTRNNLCTVGQEAKHSVHKLSRQYHINIILW